MKQTDRVPHKAQGAAQSAGVPAERAGVPAESAGVPAESAGVPAESAGTTKTSYPLMKYLSLLLAVALLFSGVTFARYLSNDRIDSSVGIAAFDASYSIDRVNSTTFGNQSYWIDVGGSQVAQGSGTAISVGMTLKNNGGTSVRPTLHFEGPKDYWQNVALQLTTADGNFAMGDVLTPQLVIQDIVEASEGDITDEEGNSFHTSTSKDYGSLGGDDVELSLTKSDSVLTAAWVDNDMTNVMTITERRTPSSPIPSVLYAKAGIPFCRPSLSTAKRKRRFIPSTLNCPRSILMRRRKAKRSRANSASLSG